MLQLARKVELIYIIFSIAVFLLCFISILTFEFISLNRSGYEVGTVYISRSKNVFCISEFGEFCKLFKIRWILKFGKDFVNQY